MSIKSVFLIILIQGIVGIFFYNFYPQFGYIPMGIMNIGGAVSEFYLRSKRSKEMIKDDPVLAEQEVGKFDNDFRNVPGDTTSNEPIRPINFLAVDPFKEVNDSLEESLKNIGLDVDKTKK
jgi:hypothetical protein